MTRIDTDGARSERSGTLAAAAAGGGATRATRAMVRFFEKTRKRFLSGVAALVLSSTLIVGGNARAAEEAKAATEPRGGRVGWARLVTPSEAWDRHSETDRVLSEFIRRQTSLNIDPTWYSADPGKLEQLCSYPLIFTNNLTNVQSAAHLKNIGEYLRRGGFVFVDACSNRTITANPDVFLKNHIALMKVLVPGCDVRELPKDHEIYRHYFAMKETPPHIFMGNNYDPQWAKHGLYGVFDGQRMVSLVSLSGLQCGWAGMDGSTHGQECMRMVVNVYVYAMTR